MNLHATRRTAAVSAAALTAAALGVLTGVTPAAADTTDPVITLHKPPTVAVATAAATGTTTTVQPDLTFTTDATSVTADLTLTVDVRKLAKIADVTFSDNCTVAKSIATCEEFFYQQDLPPNSTLGGVTQITVAARPGVAPGTTASYKISGSGTGATFVGATGSVQIGGPAFDQDQTADHSGLAVGATVSEPVRFTNTGDRPATGAQVLLVASPGLIFTQHYANCTYSFVADDRQAGMALCTFPGTFQVGEEAALATPVGLQVTSEAYDTYLDTLTLPKGDPDIPAQMIGRTFTRGKGSTLGLTVLAPGQPSSAPAGKVALNLADDHSTLQIAALHAVNTADFSVAGGAAQGAQGATAQLDFSMTQHGPATIFDRSGGGWSVMANLPPGTTVTGSSANCQPAISNDPEVAAHGPYACWTGFLIPAGRTIPFSVTVRVDSVIPGAHGSASLAWSPEGGGRPAFDPDPTDDSAALTLN
jgi:hypothetical protein